MAHAQTAEVIAFHEDPLFARMRHDAEEAIRRDPDLKTFLTTTVLAHDRFEATVVHRLASRLDHPDLPFATLVATFLEIVGRDAGIAEAMRADVLAVTDRDPACTRVIEPVLYFKGFHAIQAHRFAHALWHAGRRDFALYLQSRSSAVFQTDINPAAVIGKGIFLDHATGLVVGQTTVIDDDVSILQGVTLGGTGKERGDRHPKIRRGVLIGAGASVLGNIEIGRCSRIAAGSVVLAAVPHNTTVAGVPARVVGTAGCAEPARSMDQILADKPALD